MLPTPYETPVRLTVVYEFARVYASAQRKKYPRAAPE